MPGDPRDYFAQWHNPGLYGNGFTPPIPPGPPFFGAGSGPPSNAIEGALQSFGPMLGEMFRNQLGGYSFMFGSDMNVGSARMANQFMQQLNEARKRGAEADKEQVKQIFRGLAIAIGNKFERNAAGQMDLAPDVLRSIDVLSSDASSMLPVLAAAFPDTVDRLLPRGSMAVAAANFTNAGRFVIDPATGRPASRDSDMAARILQPLLEKGAQATYGLGAGRLGQVYEELVGRGMVGSGRELREAVEVREATKGLFGTGMSGDQARGIQSERIRERIQAYSRTVSAIHDIFAENGRPNASMAELIRSLDAMTQGGLDIYDPAKLASITRSLHSASQVSGLGIQGLTQLAAYSGSALEQYGAHRGLAAPIALRAAAYGMVYADSEFGRPSPEGMSRDEFVRSVADKQVAFSGSSIGNVLGAISALGRQAPAGSDFAQIAEAVRRGETRITLKSGRVVDLATDLPQLNDIARQSGLGGAFLQQLMAPAFNRAEFVREEGLGLAGNRLQRSEFENLLLSRLGAGFSGIRSTDLLNNIYAASRGDVGSDADVARIVGEKMGLSPEQRGTLAAALSNVGTMAGFPSGYTAYRQVDLKTADDAAKSLKFIQDRGIRLEELSGLMRGGFTRNISNLIVRAGIEGKYPSFLMSIARGAGLVTHEDVAGAMSGDTDLLGDSISKLLSGFSNRGADLTGWDPFSGGDPIAADTPGGPGGLSGMLMAARRKVNRWRNGAGAETVEDGPGFFGDIADWAKRAGSKSSAPGVAPLNVNIAKLIISQDGSARILSTEGSAATRK